MIYLKNEYNYRQLKYRKIIELKCPLNIFLMKMIKFVGSFLLNRNGRVLYKILCPNLDPPVWKAIILKYGHWKNSTGPRISTE